MSSTERFHRCTDGSTHEFYNTVPVPTEAAVREHGIVDAPDADAPRTPDAPAAPERDAPVPLPAESPRARGNAAAEDAGVVGAVLSSPMFKSFARSAASALGREITRGLFGTRRRR